MSAALPAIVMVDDERMVLDTLKLQMQQLFGRTYQYEIAENVAEAWDLIDELMEDGVSIVVVVSDWLMPEVRGDDFLADLQVRYPGIIRVMLTGQAAASALNRVRDEQLAHRLIFKPWSAGELREAIEYAAATAAEPGE